MKYSSIKYIFFVVIFFLCSCGTIFQGYYYDTKIDVPERTKIYDSSNYEIPYFLKPVYKTEDTAKYIELRTSDEQPITFVLDSHYKKITAKPKVNYLTLLFDAFSSISTYGIPLVVDYANGNMFIFDDIILKKEDFSLIKNDSIQFINIEDDRYMDKIMKNRKSGEEQGFITKDSRMSLFAGFGLSSLGFVFPIIPPHGEGGLRYRITREFEIGALAEYNFFSEEYINSDYSGSVIRYALEGRFYPRTRFGAYFSGAIDFFSAWYEKYYNNPEKMKTIQDLFGLTLGAGVAGKWWFMEANYSIGFEKIRLWDSNTFKLNYYTFTIFFNLPL